MQLNTYNNFGISTIAITSVIKYIPYLDYSKALLILPFLLHNPLVNYLKDSRRIINGLDDLIISNINLFTDFNNRYYSMLPLSTNSIILADKLELIRTGEKYIEPITERINGIKFPELNIGNRCQNIIKVSEKVATLLNEPSSHLYFKLRVEI